MSDVRKTRYLDLLEEYGLKPIGDQDPNDHADEWEDSRFVLVEHSRYGQTWITLWDTREAAAGYHDGQEYAEDWSDAVIYDLDNQVWIDFYPAGWAFQERSA